MLTVDTLRAATGCTTARAQDWMAHIQRACDLFAINTPARLAAFLAQIGHESGRLAYVRGSGAPHPHSGATRAARPGQHPARRRQALPGPGPDPDHRPRQLPRHARRPGAVCAPRARL